MGKKVHWELCKKFKSDHINKWNKHNPESILENEKHKLLQIDDLILATRPDLNIVKKIR